MNIDENKIYQQYHTNGYLHLKNFFTQEEIINFKRSFYLDKYKNGPNRSFEISIDNTYGTLLYDQRIAKVLNTLLDSNAVYFGESGLSGTSRTNKILKRWLHTDTRGHVENPYGRTSYDPSKKDYPLLALFIYLEDYSSHSGAVKIVKGSHKKFLPTIGNYLKVIFNMAKHYKFDGTYSFKAIPFFQLFKTRNICTKPGDLFIFNMALHHSANSCKLKLFPNLALPVFFENILNKLIPFVFKKNPEERKIISLIYGKNSQDLENYIKSRAQYINKEYLKNSRFFNDESFRAKIKSCGIGINLNLIEYYKKLKG